MAFKIPEMVQETTDTTGTANYVLSGAVSGFRAFDDELSDGDVTLYCVFDSTANPPIYEINRGTYTLGTTTLARTSLLRSSTGVAISWGASTKNVVAGIPGIVMQELLNKISTGTTGLLELSSSSPVSIVTTQTISTLGRSLITATTSGSLRTIISCQQEVITTAGDLVRGNGFGNAARLALGSSGTYLRSDGSDPGWSQIPASEVTFTSTSPYTATTVNGLSAQMAHPKGSTSTVGSVQTFSTTSITAITDLSNLTPPGSPNTVSVYTVNGQVTIGDLGTNGDVTLSVHLGTNGNATDGVIASYVSETGNQSGNIARRTIPIPRVRFAPTGAQKVSVSLTSGSPTITVRATDSWLWIEQISNA